MRFSKQEDAVHSNKNKKPLWKIEEVQQDFSSHFTKPNDILIKKESIAKEIVHDTEKNTQNVHNITLEHDEGSPRDHLWCVARFGCICTI